jgi:hypothetical protein
VFLFFVLFVVGSNNSEIGGTSSAFWKIGERNEVDGVGAYRFAWHALGKATNYIGSTLEPARNGIFANKFEITILKRGAGVWIDDGIGSMPCGLGWIEAWVVDWEESDVKVGSC